MPTSTLRYCAASPPRLTCAFPLPVSLARCDDLSVLIVWECQGGCRVVQWVKGRGGQGSTVSTSQIALYLLLSLSFLLLIHFYLRKLRHVGNCSSSSSGGSRGSRSVARHLQNSIVRNCHAHTHTRARAHENTHTDTDARY